MVSCVENGKNFLLVSQKSVYHGMARDGATVAQVQQDTELLQHHQFVFYSKTQAGHTQSCLMPQVVFSLSCQTHSEQPGCYWKVQRCKLQQKASQFIEVKSNFYPKSLFLCWAMNTCSASELLQSSLMSPGFGSHSCS